MSARTKQVPTIKVIIVGNSGVGKTSLVSALFNQQFDFQPMPTVAPAYNCFEVKRDDDVVVTLQIWDTAGQERYHSVNQLFYRDSDVAVVCYDPTKIESFNAVAKWVECVRDEVPDAKIFLVLTKSDLYENDDQKQFLDDAQTMSNNISADRVFVTSSSKKTGIEAVFKSAAEISSIVPATSSIVVGKSPETKAESNNCC